MTVVEEQHANDKKNILNNYAKMFFVSFVRTLPGISAIVTALRIRVLVDASTEIIFSDRNNAFVPFSINRCATLASTKGDKTLRQSNF